MRLASFPKPIVKIECMKCSRQGQYKLYGLIHRFGPDMHVGRVLEMIAGDCKLREFRRPGSPEFCGAYYTDLRSEKPQISSEMQILKANKSWNVQGTNAIH